MLKNHFHVVGVMSGTSLDGVDLAEVIFTKNDSGWIYEFGACETKPYPAEWKEKLATAIVRSKDSLELLDKQYTTFLALQINEFITSHKIKDLDAIASHGHTVFHQPQKGITKQIGNRPELAQLLQQTVVCDFRVQDVELGGQGAPLVPIGDRLLFSQFDYCINLGGFANISFERQQKRIAYDLSPVNICLNPVAEILGHAYDDQGTLARSGTIIPELLQQLQSLEYYRLEPPKSLGLEWVKAEVQPLMRPYLNSPVDLLATLTEHIALQISQPLHAGANVLFTGGGSFNSYLLERIGHLASININRATEELINFKEALIFAFLGVLRLRKEVNCLASVTGASKDHSSGNIFTSN